MKEIRPLSVRDSHVALSTFIEVLLTLARLLVPFAPFLAEHMYQVLRSHLDWAEPQVDDVDGEETAFALRFPVPLEALIDETAERQVAAMRSVLRLGRVLRHRRGVPLRTPLGSLVVVTNRECVQDLAELRPYLRAELNVAAVTLTHDHAKYNVGLQARPNWRVLGKRLGRDIRRVTAALRYLTQAQLAEHHATGQPLPNLKKVPLHPNDLLLTPFLLPTTPAHPPGQNPKH